MTSTSSNSNISQDILLGLKSAKTMSDSALSSMCELDRYSLALTTHHPSPDVRREGEIIKKNLKQMLKNQQIIMEELYKLEAAVKQDINIDDVEKDISAVSGFSNVYPLAGIKTGTPTGNRLASSSTQRERTPKMVKFDKHST